MFNSVTIVGRGCGGIVVGVLIFYSNDPSSHLAWLLIFFTVPLRKDKNKLKKAGLAFFNSESIFYTSLSLLTHWVMDISLTLHLLKLSFGPWPWPLRPSNRLAAQIIENI